MHKAKQHMIGRIQLSKILISICLILLIQAKSNAFSREFYKSGVSQEHANGVVVKIIQAVADKLQITLTIEHAPFARRLFWLKTGKLDIMGGLLKRKDREEYIEFVSTPYVNSARKIFFVRKGEEKRIQKYEDLYGLSIGTKFYSNYFPRFDQDNKIDKQPVPTVEQNFKKLISNRVDAVIYSYRSGYTALMKMGIEHKVSPADYFYSGNPVFIGISKKSPLMAQKGRIEAVVKQMVESGEIESIIAEHYRYLTNNR